MLNEGKIPWARFVAYKRFMLHQFEKYCEENNLDNKSFTQEDWNELLNKSSNEIDFSLTKFLNSKEAEQVL